MAQHAAWCEGHEVPIAVITVVDDLCRGVGGPGHDAHRGGVGPQVHVAVGGRDDVVVRPLFGEFTRHAHGHHGLGQAHAAVFGELLARQDLAACDASEVGHQAFDFGDAVQVEPVFQLGECEMVSAWHGVSCRFGFRGCGRCPRAQALNQALTAERGKGAAHTVAVQRHGRAKSLQQLQWTPGCRRACHSGCHCTHRQKPGGNAVAAPPENASTRPSGARASTRRPPRQLLDTLTVHRIDREAARRR
jgi:hypothetical protein